MALFEDTTPIHSSSEQGVESEEELEVEAEEGEKEAEEEEELEAEDEEGEKEDDEEEELEAEDEEGEKDEEGEAEEDESEKIIHGYLKKLKRAVNKSPSHSLRSASKKRSATTGNDLKKNKKMKNKADEEKVNPYARKFEEDDDIVILEGLRDWIGQGDNKLEDVPGFYKYIHGYLKATVDPDDSEIMRRKLKRLKGKYIKFNSMPPKPSNLHDLQCYEIMKVIWGDEEDSNNKRSSALLRKNTRSLKAKTSHVSADIPSSSKEVHKVAFTDIPSSSKEVQVQEVDLSAYPLLDAFFKDVGNLEILGKLFWKNGLASLEDAEAKKFEKKLGKLHKVKSKLNMKYKKLVRNLITSLLRA